MGVVGTELAPLSPLAAQGRDLARSLRARCDAQGRLPSDQRGALEMLVLGIEQGLA